MRAALTLFLVIFSLKSYAGMDYYPESFLEKINVLKEDSSTNEDVKYLVHEVLTLKHIVLEDGKQILSTSCNGHEGKGCFQQRSLSYDEARKYLFGKIHLRQTEKGYVVKGVYCQQDFTRSTTGVGKLGPMMIPNANTLNCEHTWPQSRFSGSFSKGTQKGDLHHLFPTNSHANSLRSNHKFAEVDHIINETPDCEGPKLGTIDSNPRDYYYEPPRVHRGNVARALFYFSTRYRIHISEEEEAFLRKWHKEDPVDAEEIERNNMVEEIQNNRNPYVDFPSLVDQVADF